MDASSAFVAGLALGLSSGSHCFWTCAAVMGPYLVSTDGRGAASETPRWSTVPAALRTLGWYNLGRLLAYLAVGLVVSWLAARGATRGDKFAPSRSLPC
jgi:sulfite exporter TauE/SafE